MPISQIAINPFRLSTAIRVSHSGLLHIPAFGQHTLFACICWFLLLLCHFTLSNLSPYGWIKAHITLAIKWAGTVHLNVVGVNVFINIMLGPIIHLLNNCAPVVTQSTWTDFPTVQSNGYEEIILMKIAKRNERIDRQYSIYNQSHE